MKYVRGGEGMKCTNRITMYTKIKQPDDNINVTVFTVSGTTRSDGYDETRSV